MFGNMKLRHRFLLGYSVPIVLFFIVAALVYGNAIEIVRQSELTESSHAIIDRFGDLDFSSSQMQRGARGYLLVKDASHLKAFKEGEQVFLQSVAFLKVNVKDPRQVELLDKINAKFQDLAGESKGLIALVDAGQTKQAAAYFKTEKSVQLFREAAELIKEFEAKERETLAGRTAAEETATASTIRAVWGGALLSILFAIIFGLWVTSRITQMIGESVNALTSSSSEFAATMTEHERTVGEQSAAVTEVSATAEELGVSSQTSAQQSENTAALANQSLALTEEGIKLANRSYSGIIAMKEKVGAVAEQILRLSEQAEQIGTIANVVGELAGETNMLALNAAVEAARAGEHGKGFAIVASEIRKLADQSKKSAERTNALVKEVQKATNSAVMATEEGTKTAEEVAAIAKQSGESFASLAAVANKVYEGAQQVMLNSKQQSGALIQVSEAMKNLNNGSKEITAGTAQAKIGVVKLNEVAQSLKALI
ncbi:MAG: methyl-accepting chemotaxis protein [Proteobacteria bacterium]|nr:methyl-accepting chemotaxis protein [Pseudomonadota bacterium]